MKYFSAIAILLLLTGCFCSRYTEYPDGSVTKTVYWGISTSDGIELYTTEAPEMQTIGVSSSIYTSLFASMLQSEIYS